MLSSSSELKAAVGESKAAFQAELGAFVKRPVGNGACSRLHGFFVRTTPDCLNHVGLGEGRDVHRRSRGGGQVLPAWFYGFRGNATGTRKDSFSGKQQAD